MIRSVAPAYDERPWLASYPPEVPADVDVPAVPLTRLLDDAADRFPGTVAVVTATLPGGVTGGQRLTYRQLRDEVDRFAGGLYVLEMTV